MKPSTAPIVQARGLHKQFIGADGPVPVLHDLDLDIQSGETVAILGASGSGKSTLLGLLAGLEPPSAGHLQLAGEDLGRLDEDGRAALRARVAGFVFQSFQLLPSLTALENVMLPLDLHGRRDARQQAHAALSQVGLESRARHRPAQLSGGEQQRVALARAFVGQPAVLFADEPTGNLDPTTGEHIIERLFELNTRNGATLILVTHNETLAERCDRRLHLIEGRLQP